MEKRGQRQFILCAIILALLCGICLTFTYEFKSTLGYAADTSIFTFVKTTDTECSVRLTDKSVTRAIVPNKATIDGMEYTVTSVATNGFSSASNLEKVRLPKTVSSIGNTAFANCKKLKSITLPNVVTIGTSAFMSCLSLSYMIIPETAQTVAPTILRNTATQLYVRASQEMVEGLNWATNWNGNNTNQNVEYNSDFVPEIEYKEVYSISVDKNAVVRELTLDGYLVDTDQPFSEEAKYKNVHVPAIRNGLPVIGIKEYAFMDNEISSLTIDYAPTPIAIESYAFYNLITDRVIINRDIRLEGKDWEGNNIISENLFATSSVMAITLPNTIADIGPNMFQNCASLGDIYFITPQVNESDLEKLINENVSTNIVTLPESVATIGTNAFSSISNIKQIVIPDTTTTVMNSVFEDWSQANAQVISVCYANGQLPVWSETLQQGWHPSWNSTCTATIKFTGDYTIDYHLNGGAHSGNPETYTKNDNVILNDATKLGYTFAGWYEDAEFTGSRVYSIAEGTKGNKAFYAKWTVNIYTITYDANKPEIATDQVAGSTAMSNHIYGVASALNPNGYSLAGWSFTCWNSTADGTGTSYTATEIVTNMTSTSDGNVVLYAQWAPQSFVVSYIPNKPLNASNPLTGNMNSVTHLYDTPKGLDKNQYVLEGWSFIGWSLTHNGIVIYADEQSIQSPPNSLNGSVALFAQWRQHTYSIQFEKSQPTNATNTIQPLNTDIINTQSINYEDSYVLDDNIFGLKGWTFTGWSTNADGIGDKYLNKGTISKLSTGDNATVVLYTQWRPNTYTIVYDNNQPESSKYSVTGHTASTTHNYDDRDDRVAFNGFNLTNWRFIGWITEPNNHRVVYYGGQFLNNVSSNDGATITLYAYWGLNNYSVQYISNKPINASSQISGEITTSFHPFETNVALRLNSYSLHGWVFKGWNRAADGSGTGYSDGQLVVGLSPDTISVFMYAQWEPIKVYVTYNANKPSTSSQNVMNIPESRYFSYDTEQMIGLPLTMRGYHFVRYQTSLSGTSTHFLPGQKVSTLLDIPGVDEGVDGVYRLTVYAIWNINEYDLKWKDINTNQTSLIRKYTVEDEIILSDGKASGYNWLYYGATVEKGTVGNLIINCTRTEITYTIRVIAYSGYQSLGYTKTYNVSYFDVVTLDIPPVYSGFSLWKYIHHGSTSDKTVEYTAWRPTLTQLDDIINGVYEIRMMYSPHFIEY